jgi:hypothetical protein
MYILYEFYYTCYVRVRHFTHSLLFIVMLLISTIINDLKCLHHVRLSVCLLFNLDKCCF